MDSATLSTGLRRILGLGGGVTGWLFDILFGASLGGLVAAIPLSVLQLYVGDRAHLLSVAVVVASVLGIRFMRRARTKAGPVWFGR